MSNKLNIKERILTAGSGNERRVVLDYEANLVYQYHNPERVLACYESGKGWVILQKPHYSSGGWGNGASGDGDGYYRISNAWELLNSIDATVLELNSDAFIDNKQLARINADIRESNKLAEKQKQLLERSSIKIDSKLEYRSELKLRKIRRNTQSLKGLDPIKTFEDYSTALDVFLTRKGRARKIDSYVITKDVVKQGDVVVAFRDSQDQVFMNSQVLNVSDFERKFMGNQSIIQKQLRGVAKYSIPFNVLASAELNLNETKIIEQGAESTHLIKVNGSEVERHFTGALLLENSGRKFLMDIDRLEIEHKLFNAFFVEVDASVNSIAEAYDSMKPQQVKDAEAKGIEVKRQGEWFFIKTEKTIDVHSDNTHRWEPNADEVKGPYLLQKAVAHGKGRPNNLFKPIGFGADIDALVCGTVTHQGREHKDLDLGQTVISTEKNENHYRDKNVTQYQLWELVPNTTVGNFTITGDID